LQLQRDPSVNRPYDNNRKQPNKRSKNRFADNQAVQIIYYTGAAVHEGTSENAYPDLSGLRHYTGRGSVCQVKVLNESGNENGTNVKRNIATTSTEINFLKFLYMINDLSSYCLF